MHFEELLIVESYSWLVPQWHIKNLGLQGNTWVSANCLLQHSHCWNCCFSIVVLIWVISNLMFIVNLNYPMWRLDSNIIKSFLWKSATCHFTIGVKSHGPMWIWFGKFNFDTWVLNQTFMYNTSTCKNNQECTWSISLFIYFFVCILNLFPQYEIYALNSRMYAFLN